MNLVIAVAFAPPINELRYFEIILTNKNDIVGKSKDAVAQYKKGDWWMVGYDMGSLVNESVVGKTYPVPPHQIHMI